MNIIIIYIYIRMNYNNIKYLEVSNNNNNSFYNSVFEILEGNYGKIFHNNEEIVSGTHLRKIIVKDIILITKPINTSGTAYNQIINNYDMRYQRYIDASNYYSLFIKNG